MPDTQRITLVPDPPIQGQNVEICYDFAGSGVTSATLRVTFTPGGSTEYPVKVDDPCVTVFVPENATSILVEDLDGPSPNKDAPVIAP